MMDVGFALSCETTRPGDLVAHAQQAEQAGFWQRELEPAWRSVAA